MTFALPLRGARVRVEGGGGRADAEAGGTFPYGYFDLRGLCGTVSICKLFE